MNETHLVLLSEGPFPSVWSSLDTVSPLSAQVATEKELKGYYSFKVVCPSWGEPIKTTTTTTTTTTPNIGFVLLAVGKIPGDFQGMKAIIPENCTGPFHGK